MNSLNQSELYPSTKKLLSGRINERDDTALQYSKVANKTFSKSFKKYLTQPNSCDKVQSSTRAQLVEQQKSPCANKGKDN